METFFAFVVLILVIGGAGLIFGSCKTLGEHAAGARRNLANGRAVVRTAKANGQDLAETLAEVEMAAMAHGKDAEERRQLAFVLRRAWELES